MPELPEVETTKNGITKPLLGKTITRVNIYQPKLRWPVPESIIEDLKNKTLEQIKRRGKYLLLKFKPGTLLIHLGMSGRLHIVDAAIAPEKHDHVDFYFNNICLRYRDPRRFGCILWTPDNPYQHKLLKTLGPEPLTCDFNGEHLFKLSRHRNITIKQFIMDSKIVVGVGNIYASEALFLSGISLSRAAGKISRKRFDTLAKNIKLVLEKAIKAGGTTLKDFLSVSGKPGYFSQKLHVYGRDGEPCLTCKKPIKKIIIGQRSSYYCPSCQT